MAHAYHSGGDLMLLHANDVRRLTLRQAEELFDCIGADRLGAIKARDRLIQHAFAVNLMELDWEIQRLSKLEFSLKTAIDECRRWRRAAGYTEPRDADGPIDPPEPNAPVQRAQIGGKGLSK